MEQGTASIEMLLVLPTLLVLLVLLVDLGYGWDVEIETVVAARFAGTEYIRSPRGADGRRAAWQALEDHYSALEFQPPEISSRKQPAGRSTMGGPARWSSVLEALTPWLPRLSSSRTISLVVDRRPPIGTFFDPSPTATVFVIDKNPWNYDRIPLSFSALAERATTIKASDRQTAGTFLPSGVLAILEIVAFLLGLPLEGLFWLLGMTP